MEVSGYLHVLVALPLGKEPRGTHFILGCVGAIVGLDDFGKEMNLLPLPDIEPRLFSLLGLSQFTALTELTRLVAYSCCFSFTEKLLCFFSSYKSGKRLLRFVLLFNAFVSGTKLSCGCI
jgi:hypothetical protein